MDVNEKLDTYIDKVMGGSATLMEELKLVLFYDVLYLTTVGSNAYSLKEKKAVMEKKVKMLLASDGANIKTRANEAKLVKWCKNLVDEKQVS